MRGQSRERRIEEEREQVHTRKQLQKMKHRCGTKQIVCEALNILYMNVCVDVTFSPLNLLCFLFYPTSAKLLQPGLKMSQNVCMRIFDVDNMHALYTVYFTCWVNS